MSENLLDGILHLGASGPDENGPLSADVYAIRGNTAWWIFDVGACDKAVDFIDNLPVESTPLKKNIVISHFHRDHAFNLSRVHFDNLYVGRETYRHFREIFNRGEVPAGYTVVESPQQFDDGIAIRVEPIPSSHAKGSLVLTVSAHEPCGTPQTAAFKNGVMFLGDSTYPMVGHGGPDSYNVQLLSEQIKFLRNAPAPYCIMSHRRFALQEKDALLQVLEGYYAKREPKKNVIEVSW